VRHRPADAEGRVGPVVDEVAEAEAEVVRLVDRRPGPASWRGCRRRSGFLIRASAGQRLGVSGGSAWTRSERNLTEPGHRRHGTTASWPTNDQEVNQGSAVCQQARPAPLWLISAKCVWVIGQILVQIRVFLFTDHSVDNLKVRSQLCADVCQRSLGFRIEPVAFGCRHGPGSLGDSQLREVRCHSSISLHRRSNSGESGSGR